LTREIAIKLIYLGGAKMAVSIFEDKAVIPDDNIVKETLAGSFQLWDDLQNYVQENYPGVKGEWKHYGKSSGWVFKLLSKKRSLFFFIPRNESFRLRFGISEKVAPCIETADLPDMIKEAVKIATPYTEGRSIDIDFYCNEAKVMAYVKDRQLVDVGTIDGSQLGLAKTLVQLTNQI